MRFPSTLLIQESKITFFILTSLCYLQVVENNSFALKVTTEGDVETNPKPSYYVALGSDNTWYLFTERCIKTVYRTGFPNLPLKNGDALPREIMRAFLENGEMQWQKLSQSELGGIWCMDGSLETWSWSLNVPVLSSLSEDNEVIINYSIKTNFYGLWN